MGNETLEGFLYYRSPFSDWELPEADGPISARYHLTYMHTDPHYLWTRAVADYARTGNATHLAEALSWVTPDNPPTAQVEVEEPPADEWNITLFVVWFVLLLITVIVGVHIVFPA